MSFLNIYQADTPKQVKQSIQDAALIQSTLADKGVRFERWQANAPITTGADPVNILAAYDKEIQRLKNDNGFQTADVICLTPEHPDKAALRAKFLSEHIHSEDEVRFFVQGSGLFYMHLEDEIFVVGCEKDDLISVPAGTKHWFDMGDAPDFTCIRLFTNPDGWVAQYTEDNIADNFPRFEDLQV